MPKTPSFPFQDGVRVDVTRAPHHHSVSANNSGRRWKDWWVESKNAPRIGYIYIKSIFTSLPLTPPERE